MLTTDIDLSIVCGEDIDGEEVSWTPIGTSEHPYTGTVDGQNKGVSGLSINVNMQTTDVTPDELAYGLFGFVGTGGMVENLSVDGSIDIEINTIPENEEKNPYGVAGSVGSVAGSNSGTVTSCSNEGDLTVTVEGWGMRYGPGVGNVSSSTSVGGVVGSNGGEVEACKNSGAVNSTGPLNYVGGIVGNNAEAGSAATGCNNSGDVTGTGDNKDPYFDVGENYVGGVAGHGGLSGSVTGCSNRDTSKVTGMSNDSKVGGVMGSGANIANCTNVGIIAGSGDIGGVVGLTLSSATNCANTGSVSGSGMIGGVMGSTNIKANVANCYNNGVVTGSGVIAGVVGENYYGTTVTNCYNCGEVTNTASVVYGVIGENGTEATVTNCYFLQQEGLIGVGGSTDEETEALAKSADAFRSGEVAWLLEAGQDESVTAPVWGQRLTEEEKDNYPKLLALDAGAPQVYKVAYMDGATEYDAQYANEGTMIMLPENPEEPGYDFEGWYKDPNFSGEAVTGEITLTDNSTYYGKWTAITYTVAVTAGEGGSVASTATSGVYGTSVTVTATANEGYHFVNWTEDGKQVSTESNYKFTLENNRTLVANFAIDEETDPDNPSTDPDDPEEENPSDESSTPDRPSTPSGPNTYPPTVEDSDHGSVEIDNDEPEAGETVTITPKPDEGYEVDDVIVTDEDGNRVEVTENPDGSWSYEQPESDVTIEVIFGEIEPEPTTDVSEIFMDVAPNAWYKDAVQYAYDNGLMTGVSANEFAPEQTTTRAMIVSILARLENVTSAESTGFADVSDEWFATAVNWAASVGVVNGFEDNTFRPNDPITREQLAAILMNYSAWKGEDVSARADLTTYIDQPSAWARETMQWAVAEGLISGVTNDELQPQGNATRAQVAAILQRYLTK